MIKKGDTIPGFVSMAIGLVTMILVWTNPKMVVISADTYGGIGPGFFPFVCGVSLLVLGLAMVFQGLKQKGTVDYWQMDPERKENLKMVVALMVMLAIMLAAWKISKMFFLCLPLYLLGMNKLLKRNWLFTILFTVGMTLFIYGLFRVGFSIRFRP